MHQATRTLFNCDPQEPWCPNEFCLWAYLPKFEISFGQFLKATLPLYYQGQHFHLKSILWLNLSFDHWSRRYSSSLLSTPISHQRQSLNNQLRLWPSLYLIWSFPHLQSNNLRAFLPWCVLLKQGVPRTYILQYDDQLKIQEINFNKSYLLLSWWSDRNLLRPVKTESWTGLNESHRRHPMVDLPLMLAFKSWGHVHQYLY